MNSEEDFNELDYPDWLYRELIDPRQEFGALTCRSTSKDLLRK